MNTAVAISAALAAPGEGWDQGDIVSAMYFFATDEKRPAILVTPTCDVAQGKIPFWTFVALFRDDEVAADLVAPELRGFGVAADQTNKNQRKQLAKIVANLVGQRYPRYQWIPVTVDGHTGFVADFTLVQSVTVGEAQEHATRIARLVPSWREQAPVRYASYMGRIGTDDFHAAEVEAAVERVVTSALVKCK